MSTPYPVPRPPLPVNAPPVRLTEPGDGTTGHPAVDAMLASLANAASLSPADQIAEYEAAHQILRETLATIDQA